MSKVAFVKTENRDKGVKSSLSVLGLNPVKNKDVLIKPNFNTADPAPGSTHNDTLTALVDELWNMGAKSIGLGERSYPPTREVMDQKGIVPLLKQRDVHIIDFDDLKERDWVECKPKHGHWENGFRIARPILEAECLISTCCLKTHQFGGAFTLSLKLHVGVVPTFRHGYQYMGELHQSLYQQEMIAEINQPFSPEIVVLDGIDAFTDGGPATGKRAKGNVFLASTDRVAQRQIARAAELGIGVSSAAEIEILAADRESLEFSSEVEKILLSEKT
ncbi:MAG: DUF362 domain-containing protein [Deltaproteobacteria bacterium]|nr:DUF362 domain-containing protein [Deltaproteobacteria bacterium]